jgi:diadenosine tetraphosphate (Ap4A) HIT family hydrolase
VDCKYCAAAEPGAPAGLHELASWPASRVYLLPDARHPGRCVVASRVHVRELHDLDSAARQLFIDEVARVARAVQQALAADKINLGLFGDIAPHLHAHVVPKFAQGADWGAAFALGGEPATDGAGAERIEAAFSALQVAIAATA